jgi:hypothetical protein
MSTPSIKVGQGNWGIKAGNLLAYANTDKKFVAREFTVGRLLDTATRVNASGNIEGVNANVPRIDYFGGQASLLVEPSAANGILNSTDTTTNWALGANLTSGAIDVIGVSGNNLTVAVSGGNIGASAGRLVRFSNNVALASGSTYTISFFVKKTGAHTIAGYYAAITGGAAGDLGGGFNVSGSFSSGSIYNSAGTTNRIRRVEQWGTDVFRCSETFTMTASGTLTSFSLAPLSGVTSAINPAVGLGIGFAAPQLELGSVPTSFIPTTTGPVTRNADAISLTGATNLIGQTEGTIYMEVDVRNLARETYLIRIDEGATANVISLRKLATNEIRTAITAPTTSGTLNISSAAFTAGIVKIAFAYKSGEIALSVNGATALTANGTFSFAASLNRITLGSNTSASSEFNDRIRAASIYQTRLPNTTTDGSPSLQSITTL